MIYLDHAAATPVDERVIKAMLPYMSEYFFNPSSPYAPAVAVRHDYEAAKQRIARCIGGTGDEIIMTAGATESVNLAINSSQGHVITDVIEHPAVLEAVKQQNHTIVPVDERGCVSPGSVADALRPDTTLVTIALANNELGTIQPLREISQIIQQERARRREAGEKIPLYFHTDASQGVGQLDVHTARLGIDMMTINSAKIYGPKQVACLWVSRHVTLRPVIVGGGQERGLRAGTENVAGTIGCAVALEAVMRHRQNEAMRLRALRDSIQTKLLAAFPSAIVSGSQKRRLPGHLNISFPGIDAERLIFMLERERVYVATGSACSANKGLRSHVLSAIGLSDKAIDGSLRITLGRLSTGENTERAVQVIINSIQSEQERLAR